jgi:serine/threonine protein kinase
MCVHRVTGKLYDNSRVKWHGLLVRWKPSTGRGTLVWFGLVTLVGTSMEVRALVHELVPGGSLEGRLIGDAALARAVLCICWKCALLAFLHSIVTRHSDIRPANILLEESVAPPTTWAASTCVGSWRRSMPAN